METTSQYRYRIEHVASRVVTFTPWRNTAKESRQDIHEVRDMLNYLSWQKATVITLSDVLGGNRSAIAYLQVR
jgi:hypothetical protein